MLVIDSVWSDERKPVREKEGMQKRRLNDGSEFEIFKKYFAPKEVASIGNGSGFKSKIEYFGKAMFVASLQKK